MRRVCVVFLLSAAFAWAQQPQNQGQNPPSAASPTASPDSQQQQPTPTPSRQDKASVNSQIESNIESVLSGDPTLGGINVQTSVDDSNITLTGTVDSEAQMRRVLQLVAPYSSYRSVVNKITVR
jgi:osmotically-inducible protein OsmY